MARVYQPDALAARRLRPYRPGALARWLLRRVGDIAVAVAGAEKRHTVLSELASKDVQLVKASAEDELIAVEEEIKDAKRELELAVEAHQQQKAEPRRHRIEQAAAWRSVGIEERIPNLMLPGLGRAAILTLLASLDFYIFAQAYAAADGSIRDWHDPGGGWAACSACASSWSGWCYPRPEEPDRGTRAAGPAPRGGSGPAQDRPGGAREAGDHHVAAAVAAEFRRHLRGPARGRVPAPSPGVGHV